MSLDVKTRMRIAEAIQDYLDCEIDNFALDDVLAKAPTDDAVCQEISGEMWFFYDDCSRHLNEGKFKISPDDEQSVHRWIALLRSSADWTWMRWHGSSQPSGVRGALSRFRDAIKRQTPALQSNKFWPWVDQADWSQWASVFDVPSESAGPPTA
jgi:hypothetical protein